MPIFNMVPPPGIPAQFAYRLLLSNARINFHVRSGGDYGLTASLDGVSEAFGTPHLVGEYLGSARGSGPRLAQVHGRRISRPGSLPRTASVPRPALESHLLRWAAGDDDGSDHLAAP